MSLLELYREQLGILKESYCRVFLIHKDCLEDFLIHINEGQEFEIIYLKDDLVQVNIYQ